MDPAHDNFALMIDWLRNKERRRNAISTKILTSLGTTAIDLLVQEATADNRVDRSSMTRSCAGWRSAYRLDGGGILTFSTLTA